MRMSRAVALGQTLIPMKNISGLAFMLGLLVFVAGGQESRGAEQGIALAIVYDTSGSMREPAKAGNSTRKYIVANRALSNIAARLEAFTKSREAEGLKLMTVLYIFSGDGVRPAIDFGPFKAQEFKDWAARFSNPAGNTPLGNALKTAGNRVLDAHLTRNHVLVITDGINTAGPEPATMFPALAKRAEQEHTSVSVHFVAFDVDAKVFAPLKKLGVNVVGAANEAELNANLDFILRNKILLEDEEEPGPAKP